MAGPDAPMSRWNIAPCFLVDDVVQTANFYRDRLGFQYERFWGDPPGFCIVYRRSVFIMLSRAAPGLMRPNGKAVPDGDAWDAYVWVDDADALIADFRSKGVTIARDICDQPYGNRDFDVLDCNGYRLCFGHDISRE